MTLNLRKSTDVMLIWPTAILTSENDCHEWTCPHPTTPARGWVGNNWRWNGSANYLGEGWRVEYDGWHSWNHADGKSKCCFFSPLFIAKISRQLPVNLFSQTRLSIFGISRLNSRMKTASFSASKYRSSSVHIFSNDSNCDAQKAGLRICLHSFYTCYYGLCS